MRFIKTAIYSLLLVSYSGLALAQPNPTSPAAKPEAAAQPAIVQSNPTLAGAKPAAAPAATTNQKASYVIGYQFGVRLRNDNVAEVLDINHITAGIADAMKSAELRFSQQELEQAMALFAEQMRRRMAAQQAAEAKKMKPIAEKNSGIGTAFLAANSKKEGVRVLPSGLQYKVIKSGTGATPKATDTVTTHYAGRLINGTEFDSSYKRGKPASFPVNGVIAGWTEALQLMKVGDKWQLFIPSDLAYGTRGSRPSIGPNETLIFEIELLGIK